VVLNEKSGNVLKNFFLLVDNFLPGSSANGYVGSFTLGNLDRVEVFVYSTSDCNTIPTPVMDCIALRRGVKPYTLNHFKESTTRMSSMCVQDRNGITKSPLI
jgi:hypothetical protein